MKVSTRQDDEQLLRWVGARTRGLTSYEIAMAEGVRPEAVRTATTRVVDADIEECAKVRAPGDAAFVETRDVVLAGYWGRG